MKLKTLSQNLLFRIAVAIVLGIGLSFIAPEWLGRVFATFNGLFGNFLNFFIPVLIFALIAPAIAALGRGAGKWLGVTAGIAWGSTIIAGLLAYGVSLLVYPWMLAGQTIDTNVSDIDAGALEPYFKVEMPAPIEVMTALLLSFCIGVAMTQVKSDNLYNVTKELENVVVKVIWGFVIPLLPFYIFGMFLDLGMNGNLVDVLVAFGKVLLLSVAMTLVYLVIQYLIAGAITGKNPFKALKNMLPAYATALGTSSSAAAIPVTLENALKNNISKPVASFVVPLCATIHIAGSMIKLMLYAFAIIYLTGMDVSFDAAMGFMVLLSITMIAAPGVPGGAVMVAVGLLSQNMGFDDNLVALMIAAYIAVDSVGTAANVTGDGAIAMIVDKFARGKVNAEGEPANTEAARPVAQDERP